MLSGDSAAISRKNVLMFKNTDLIVPVQARWAVVSRNEGVELVEKKPQRISCGAPLFGCFQAGPSNPGISGTRRILAVRLAAPIARRTNRYGFSHRDGDAYRDFFS